jgi:hypothetical protein
LHKELHCKSRRQSKQLHLSAGLFLCLETNVIIIPTTSIYVSGAPPEYIAKGLLLRR